MMDFSGSTERPSAPAAKKHVANLPRRKKAPSPGTAIPVLFSLDDAEAYLRAKWPGDFTSSPQERRVAAALLLGFQDTLHALPTIRRKKFVAALVPLVMDRVERAGLAGGTREKYMAEATSQIAGIGGTEHEGNADHA